MSLPLSTYQDVIKKVSGNLSSYMPKLPLEAGSMRRPSQMPTGNSFTQALTGMPMTNPTRSTGYQGMPVRGAASNAYRIAGGPPLNPSSIYHPSSSNQRIAQGPMQAVQSALLSQALSGNQPYERPPAVDSSLSTGLEGTKTYQTMMDKASKESGVPWQVLAAIMGIESGGQNLPANNSGAVGVMQVVTKYWQETANKYGGNLMDPYTNIRTAADILMQNYNTYGSWEKAAAAYFGGAGAFNPDGSYSDSSDSFGTDINAYVDRFLANMSELGYGSPTSAEQLYGSSAANATAQQAIDLARTVIGTPYVWGGADAQGFDCSGLVQWVYAQSGKQLARTAQDQYVTTQRIGYEDLQPGDLIFFTGTSDSGQAITHVGIYLGNGQMIHAPKEGDTVRIANLNDAYWSEHTWAYGRVT